MLVPQAQIIERCRHLFTDLATDVRKGFADFNDHQTPEVRLSVEDARAKWVSARVMALWKQRYGESLGSPVRVQKVDGLKVLFVEGKKYSIGIRFKKLDDDFTSMQSVTEAQSNLRENGSFPQFETDVAHIFFGYKQADALEPELRSIWLTSECLSPNGYYILDWRHLVWDAMDGVEPIRPIQQPLPTPPEPRLVPRPAAGKDGRKRERNRKAKEG